jgi:hypothetical protein
MSICQVCSEGVIGNPIPRIVTVTHEMAMDAGDMSLEGTQWDMGAEWQYEPCWCCQGDWKNCPTCASVPGYGYQTGV